MSNPTNEFPTFPSQVIKNLPKQFVDLYAPIREVPQAFLWLAFITYFGNLVSPYVRLNGDSSEPRFFGVVIGRSARTRKSSGNKCAMDLFKRVSEKGIPQNIIEGFGSAEGLLRSLSTLPDRPALVHLDEMHTLASKIDIPGSVGVGPLHKLFEEHAYEHSLSQSGHQVRNAYLSLLGASTKDDFVRCWASQAADAGFFSRLFLVASDASEKRIPFPVDPDPTALNSLVQDVFDVASRLRERKPVLQLEESAKEAWANFYSSFGDGDEWNRIDTYGFRLMCLLSSLAGEGTVSEQTVEDVIDLCKYEVQVKEAVVPVVAENSAAEMEQRIIRELRKHNRITKRALQRAVHAERFGTALFNQAVNVLRTEGDIAETKKGRSTFYNFQEQEDAEEVSPDGLVTSDEDLIVELSAA